MLVRANKYGLGGRSKDLEKIKKKYIFGGAWMDGGFG